MGHHGVCWQWESRPTSALSFPDSTCEADALLQSPSSFCHVTNICFPKKKNRVHVHRLHLSQTYFLIHDHPLLIGVHCSFFELRILCVCVCMRACVCVFECVLKLKVKTRRIWFKGVCAKGWISQCISLQWRLHQGCVTIQSSPLTFFLFECKPLEEENKCQKETFKFGKWASCFHGDNSIYTY